MQSHKGHGLRQGRQTESGGKSALEIKGWQRNVPGALRCCTMQHVHENLLRFDMVPCSHNCEIARPVEVPRGRICDDKVSDARDLLDRRGCAWDPSNSSGGRAGKLAATIRPRPTLSIVNRVNLSLVQIILILCFILGIFAEGGREGRGRGVEKSSKSFCFQSST